MGIGRLGGAAPRPQQDVVAQHEQLQGEHAEVEGEAEGVGLGDDGHDGEDDGEDLDGRHLQDGVGLGGASTVGVASRNSRGTACNVKYFLQCLYVIYYYVHFGFQRKKI